MMNSIATIPRSGQGVGTRMRQSLSPFMRPVRSVDQLQERQYRFMQAAFERTGGLVSGTELAHRLGRSCDQPISRLARWIVDRTIVSLEWRSAIHVPMFQFEARTMVPREPVLSVLAELRDVFDGWQTALWFSEPNYWLGGHCPLEEVRQDPSSVIEAARADRFLIRG